VEAGVGGWGWVSDIHEFTVGGKDNANTPPGPRL